MAEKIKTETGGGFLRHPLICAAGAALLLRGLFDLSKSLQSTLKKLRNVLDEKIFSKFFLHRVVTFIKVLLYT